MKWDFSGKNVLVTGASRGIGKAIAERFSICGAQVWGTSTCTESWTTPATGIHTLTVDFSNNGSTALFLEALRSIGRIDICINNAGVNRIKPVEDVTASDYAHVLSVDLQGPYLVCQAVIPSMRANNWGRIVNIASIWSVISRGGRSLYSTAKTGLVGMTRAMAVECASADILINSVSPGFVETDLTRQSLTDTEIDQISNTIPRGRLATPPEIAEVVCFLSSPLNTYLTGQNIVVDGGFSLV